MKMVLWVIILAIFVCYPAVDYWANRISKWIDKKFPDEERREE